MSNTSLHRISKIFLLTVLLGLSAFSQRSVMIHVDTLRSYLKANLTIATKYRIVVDSMGAKHDTIAYLSDLDSAGGGYFKKVGGKISPKISSDTLALAYAQLDSLKAALARLQMLLAGLIKADSLRLISGNALSGDTTGIDLIYKGAVSGKAEFPTPSQTGSGYGSGYVAMTGGNEIFHADTMLFQNPANQTNITLVNNSGSADTTLDILGILGGNQVGVKVTNADVTNTDGVLADDAYLYATIGGTTNHSNPDGSIWTGYLDLFFNVGTGTSGQLAFTVPDPGYSVMDIFVNYFTYNGATLAETNPLIYAPGYTSGTSESMSFGQTGVNAVRVNFYLDNQYGYSGDLKLQWAATTNGNSTSVLRGSTLVAYRIK